MSVPVANFSYIASGLSLTFTDSSLNSPTSWLWDFGDVNSGSTNSSTSQNPTHTFSLPGTYAVKLTATNVDGDGEKTINIYVSEGAILLSIKEMVGQRLPGNMTVDTTKLENYIKVEQLFLQPLVNPEMTQAMVFDEEEWPPLANVLVAELVAYKIILDTVNQLTLALSNTSSNTSTQTQSALKKIVTGPSQAEFYDQTTTVTDFLSSTFKEGSIFEKASVQVICNLAQRLNIDHPLCQVVHKHAVLPKIARFN